MSLKNHHAFLASSSHGYSLEKIREILLGELDFKIQGNPDYFEKEIETFGIEDSRVLKNLHSGKQFSENELKIFVIKTDFITHEAQNALLKILEDPNENSKFFFILPSSDNILPTLLSRFTFLDGEFKVKKKIVDILAFKIDDFLNLGIPARLKLISRICKEKDKKASIEFINKIEEALRKKIKLQNTNESELALFETISKSKKYIRSRGASIKLILENLCLDLPQF